MPPEGKVIRLAVRIVSSFFPFLRFTGFFIMGPSTSRTQLGRTTESSLRHAVQRSPKIAVATTK